MEQSEIKNRLSDILYAVDTDEWDELIDHINEYLLYDEIDQMELVKEIFYCNKTKALPKEASDLVEDILNEEIENGNSDAANDLGVLYYTGRNGKQSYAQAFHYYELAAKMGNTYAQENLGYCYYYGRDCEIDYEKAFQYFSLGAFKGDIRSLYKIGDMYKNGYYVEKNEAEAYAIYDRCEQELSMETYQEAGPDIYMRLGDCANYGIGRNIDYSEALQYYQHAEQLFYKRLQTGDFLIKGCYEKVIRCQTEVREKMRKELPDYNWTD